MIDTILSIIFAILDVIPFIFILIILFICLFADIYDGEN